MTKEEAKNELDKVQSELKRLAVLWKLKHAKENLSTKQVLTAHQKLLEAFPRCAKCGFEKNLTVEHIIPQSITICFGLDSRVDLWPENLEVLCRRCNQWKANRLDTQHPKTKALLQELLNRI